MNFFAVDDALLIELRKVQYKLANSSHSENDKNLRGNAHREHRERWHGAIFAYALAKAFNLERMCCKWETTQNSEHDITLSFDRGGKEFIHHIQLKEMPPSHLQPKLTLQGFLDQIAAKKLRSAELTIACFLNRDLVNEEFKVPALEVAQLWFFGWGDSAQSSISLLGDLMTTDSADDRYLIPYPGYSQP